MKEVAKTLAIVILFFTIVFLIGELWLEPFVSESENSVKDDEYTVEDVSYLLDVKAVNYGFGFGQMTTFFFDKFEGVNKLKFDLINGISSSVTIEKIPRTQYYGLREYKFFEYVLPSAIKTEHLLSLSNNKNVNYEAPFKSVDSLLVTASQDNIFYVKDGNEYYQITTKKKLVGHDSFFDNIMIEEFNMYQSLARRFSLENSVDQMGPELLIPTNKIDNFHKVKVSSETNATDDEAINALATSAFGARLNFVREMVDVSGDRVMLYGYGERALKITKDGRLEYSRKVDVQAKSERNFIRDLKIALTGIENLNGEAQKIKLDSVTEIQVDNAKGYLFKFFYRINHYKVVGDKDYAGITVEVLGGKVKTIKRNLKHYLMVASPKTPVLDDPFFQMLNNPTNFDILLKNHYAGKSDVVNSDKTYQEILMAISDFEIAYLDSLKGELIPVFIITEKDKKYYFNYETTELILTVEVN